MEKEIKLLKGKNILKQFLLSSALITTLASCGGNFDQRKPQNERKENVKIETLSN
jgi:hypothetical protein